MAERPFAEWLAAEDHRAEQHQEPAGPATSEETDTFCCYALQDKAWVTGPGNEPRELYVVKADTDNLGESDATAAGGYAQIGMPSKAVRR